MTHPRLVALLYLLARDELAAGKIERLMIEAEKAGPDDIYSSKELERMAREWAKRLIQ